jgi:hypothetical protein
MRKILAQVPRHLACEPCRSERLLRVQTVPRRPLAAFHLASGKVGLHRGAPFQSPAYKLSKFRIRPLAPLNLAHIGVIHQPRGADQDDSHFLGGALASRRGALHFLWRAVAELAAHRGHAGEGDQIEFGDKGLEAAAKRGIEPFIGLKRAMASRQLRIAKVILIAHGFSSQ